MGSILNPLLLVFSNFGMRLLEPAFHVLYCGPQIPIFALVAHIQGMEHVRLFWLNPNSLPCHSSRHVENLPEMSCCLQK
jgi:hypothetical protein